MRSGWSSGSIYLVLLVSGWFRLPETIIPEAQEHFLIPSARRDTHPFGGLGLSRDLPVVTQEATALGGADYPKLVWLMDNRLETNPVIISTLPMQDTDDFFNRPGRYGAHNIHENRPGPLALRSDTLVYATFFNGGIRVFDTTNPFQPQEVAYYIPIPQIPEGADANGINDVHVDENGITYVVDRLQGGLYILEMNL